MLKKSKKEKRNHPLRRVIKSLLIIFLLFPLIGSLPPVLFRTTEAKTVVIPEEDRPGELVKNVEDNEEALLWRFRIIASAKESIDTAIYEFDPEGPGHLLISALYDAAERGVKIRILSDGISFFYRLYHDPSYQTLAAHPNVEAKIYNSVNILRPDLLQYRMHDKFLIIDDHTYLVSGRNNKPVFLENTPGKTNHDRDIIVHETNPSQDNSLKQLRSYFNDLWTLDTSLPFAGKEAEGSLALPFRVLCMDNPEIEAPYDYEGNFFPADRVDILTNPAVSGEKAPVVWETLTGLMKKAPSSVICTPYIIPDRNMASDLKEIGDKLTVTVNAPEIARNYIGAATWADTVNMLKGSGITMIEHVGSDPVHAKLFLIGDDLTGIGSMNCDMRSAYIDQEAMVLVRSRDFCDHMKKTVEEFYTHSRRLLEDGSYQYTDNTPVPEESLPRKILRFVLRYLSMPLKPLLSIQALK